jgi:hypothetical protein
MKILPTEQDFHLARLPAAAGVLYLASQSVLLLDTSYLILKKMSNAERPVQNVELGKLVSSVIRHPSLVSCISFLASRSVLFLGSRLLYLSLLGTWYLVLSTIFKPILPSNS